MFEIARPRRLTSRELQQRLSALSAQAVEREVHIHDVRELSTTAMEEAVHLLLQQQALMTAFPNAASRLRFITDVAIQAMTETAIER